MSLKVITDVSSEPLTEAFILNYLKYTGGDSTEEALINSMAKAARQLIERKYNLALAAQTLQIDVRKDDIKDYSIQLERYPQKGYNSSDATEFKVYTVDSKETETLLTYNDGYFLEGRTNWIKVRLGQVSGTLSSLPEVTNYKIEYVAGYGITDFTELMPEAIKIAMAQLVSEWYQNKGNYVETIPDGGTVDRLMLPFSYNTWL